MAQNILIYNFLIIILVIIIEIIIIHTQIYNTITREVDILSYNSLGKKKQKKKY